jgi:hypothetical protein
MCGPGLSLQADDVGNLHGLKLQQPADRASICGGLVAGEPARNSAALTAVFVRSAGWSLGAASAGDRRRSRISQR